MVNFGQWIRHMQAIKDIPDEVCQTRAGMTQPNWSRLVNSPPEQPRKSTMQAVARALEVPLSEVMVAAGYEDKVEFDTRFSRQLEPYLMRVPIDKRATAERMLVEQARYISEMLTV